MPNEREGFEKQYSEGWFTDFVDDHTRPISEPSAPSLMSEGLYRLDTSGQILPFDRVEFAQFRGVGEDDDPNVVERSEITLFIGELEIITITFNLLTAQFILDLNGSSKKDLSEAYKHLPTSLIEILKDKASKGGLVEATDEEDDLQS